MMAQNAQHNDTVWLRLTKWVSGNDYDSDAGNVDDDVWNRQEMLVRLENVAHIQHVKQRWYVHLYTSVPTQPALGRLGPNSVRFVRNLEVNAPLVSHHVAPVKRRHVAVVKSESHVSGIGDDNDDDMEVVHLNLAVVDSEEPVVNPDKTAVNKPSKKKRKTKTADV